MATTVLRTFEIYQKARVQFVQTVAELANRKENYEALQSAGVLLLLRPLLLDVVPSVSQTACIAIGRMAENSAQVAQEIISLDILPDIVESIPQQNRFFKKCAAYVIRNIAMHNKHLAQEVVRAGGLNALGQILTEFDPSVKEAACWAISYIAKHNEELAGAVTEAITLKDLVLCIQEPELGLRQIACNALMQIARHKPELAKKVSDNETNLLPFLGPLIHHPSPKLQRQAIACLSHIAYHNQVLAEQVIQFIKVDKLLGNLKNDDAGVRINSAECIKNIVRHRAESGKIMSKDNAKPLIDYIAKYKGPAIEPALMAISCIATFDEILAMGIINSGAVPILKDRLTFDTDPTIKMRAAHALGCLGGFGEDHAREVANGGVLTEFKRIIYSETKKQEKRNVELLDVCKEANKKIISHCKHMDALYELIDNETQNDSLILVLKQILKILPNSNPAKKKFAESGGLEKLLIIKDQRERSVVASEKMDKTVESIIDDICKSYNNDDLINYYTPNFEQKIVAEKLDKLSQQVGE